MNDVPSYARWVSAGMAAAAALGLLLNHFAAEAAGMGRVMILVFAPVGLCLGIGGVIEPKILWSLGKYGTHLPLQYKAIGGALAGLGVIITLLLVFFVYSLGFSQT